MNGMASGGVTRRAMMRDGALLLGGLATGGLAWGDAPRRPALRAGLVADVHYADKDRHGSRYYRHSLDKLGEAVKRFNQDPPDFAVHLGDYIDRVESVEREVTHLRTIDRVFAQIRCERHYVLGNHCVDTLYKEEFIENSGARAPHYAFDAGPAHFIVLDSCFRSDGQPYGRHNFHWTDANIPADQLDWLRADLAATEKPAIVLAHQRLDGEGNHHVNNAAAVREILADSGKVVAVFQGHSHRNDYDQRDGIHYCTLVAMVEGEGPDNSGYAIMSVYDDASIRLEGFRHQQDRSFS